MYMEAFFTEDILTCHNWRSKGVNNKMNASVSGSKCCSCCTLTHCHDLLGHFNRTEPLLYIISNSCAFPTMSSQHVCCEFSRALYSSYILYSGSRHSNDSKYSTHYGEQGLISEPRTFYCNIKFGDIV